MIVRELIEELQKHNPEAEVRLECWVSNEPKEVCEYIKGDTSVVYIGDYLDYMQFRNYM